MLDFLINSIKRDKPNDLLVKPVQEAAYQKAMYLGSGETLDKLLWEYRTKESDPQKKQRKRITISRSKHTIRQIENVINQLDTMDKPAINVIPVEKDDPRADIMKEWIYNNNIASFCFEMVKYNNIVDANSFCVAGINEYNDLEFKVYPSSSVYDFYIVNGNLQYVIFQSERTVNKKTVKDYILYSDESIVKVIHKEGKQGMYNPAEIGPIENYYIEEEETKKNFAFPLGILKDATTNQKTFVALVDSASELLKSLHWQGSDLDTAKGTHGIIQKFAYTKPCRWTMRDDTNGNFLACNHGFIERDGTPTGHKCDACQGSGEQIHTSSQDVMTFPFPDMNAQNPLKLSDLTHTVFAPDNFLTFLKTDVADIVDEIMRTVFNSTIITKDEIAATATEKVIDLQGIYSTLNQVGMKVSDLFIWMCEVKASIEGYEGLSFLHGYTLNLKLESIESLAAKRKSLLDSGAPMEIIKSVDLAIMQKQHIDSPQAIERFSVWERYRPFSDKSENVVISIISGLAKTSRYRILYEYFGMIKSEVTSKYGNDFFTMSHTERLKVINEEVDKIREEIKQSDPVNEPLMF